MWKFIVKRVLISILILFFVGLIIYGIMRCMPVSFIEQKAMALSSKPGAKPYAEWLAQLTETYGFDCGIFEGFFRWCKGAVKFDFGESWYFNQSVTKKFESVIWYSFALGLASFILEIFISIPLGIKAAKKQYSGTDYAITVFALIGISLPSFFFATILKYIFSVKLNWFELFGIVSRTHLQMTPSQQIIDIAKHYVLPTITLTICSIGSLMRFTRANMLEVLNSDYIRTARAKGVSEKRVVNYHAFRNILIPIVTLLGGTLPSLFSGAMITETLFQIPGIGYTSYVAIMQGDIPFVMFYMVFSAVLILLGNLITDILYAVVDPRVRVN